MKIVDRFRDEIPEATITYGTPQTDAEIDALEAEIGLSFPEDYRTFLRDHGAVKIDADTPDFYGDIVVWGIGIDGIDIREGMRILDEECRSWSRAPLGMLPILGHYEGDVHDTLILGDDGKLYFHYRGHAETASSETLTEGLEAAFEALKKSLAKTKTERAAEDAVLAETLETVDGGGASATLEMLASMFRSRRGSRAVHFTNEGGHDVEVRMGDGRELHVGMGNLPGLFFLWYEPADGRTVAVAEPRGWEDVDPAA